MGLPKITKPSQLREDLYNTLDRVSRGERHVVPTKSGDVVIISKMEYDSLIDDLDLLKEFDGHVDVSELIPSDEIFAKLERKHGFANAGPVDKKGRKKSR